MADNVTFQSTTLATPASGTVAATDDVGGVHYQRVKVDLGGDGVSSPLVAGQLADANSLPVTLSTEGTAQLGSLTEGAPATDTASSGLNGRLQRIAQRLTSILAKLPALGTAGTASSDVITIQGIASMTAVKVDGSGVTQPVSGTVTANLAAGTNNIGDVDVLTVPTDPFGATADAAVVAGATGSISAKLRSISRDLVSNVVLAAGTNAIGKLAANAGVTIGAVEIAAAQTLGTVTTVGTVTAITNAVTVNSHAVTNAGTFATQVDGAALTALQLIDDPVVQDDTAFTPATTKVMMAGFEADESGTDSVDEGDGGAGRMTLDRKQIVNPQPHTAGGLSVAQLNGSDGGGGVLVATAQVVKASAGQLYGYYIYNPNATATFVHFYNTAAASVTVGTTNPLMSVTIPANMAANLALPYGITFSNAGWSAAATTTAGGNTAPGTGLDVTVFYL